MCSKKKKKIQRREKKNLIKKKKMKTFIPQVKPEIISTLKNKGYTVIESVGKGGYSSCLKVLSSKYNKYFVAKITEKGGTDPGRMANLTKSFSREIGALGSLLHPNIINLYEHFFNDDYLFLIIDYCEGGSIEDYMSENFEIETNKLILYTKQLVEAFTYIHSSHIAHHDIKPGNILLDGNGNLKISDFGLSNTYGPNFDSALNFKGTLPYMAPEVVNRGPYDPYKADVWSLGITLYYMATCDLPFQSKDPKVLKELIKLGKYSSPSSAPKLVRDVIRACLVDNPKQRATMAELLAIVHSNLSNLPQLNQGKMRTCKSNVPTSYTSLQPSSKCVQRRNISFVGPLKKSTFYSTGRTKLINT